MTEKEKEQQVLAYLIKVMDDFTTRNYGVRMNIPVEWSGRLTARWGYFRVQKMTREGYYEGKKYQTGQLIDGTMKIVLSKQLMKAKNKSVVIQIAKHEALHYALCVLGKPFSDGHPVFEGELKKHGLISNYATTEEKNKTLGKIGVTSRKWVWVCGKCNKIMLARGKTRKDYSRGYHSSCCKHSLVEKGWQEIETGQTHLKK